MNPFKKETSKYESLESQTPYQRAKAEWDERIGGVKTQANNWRLAAILSLFTIILLLVTLLVVISSKTDRIFIAEVTKEGRVVNLSPLQIAYQPTVAQQEYFVAHFIKLVRSLPLDPVVAKNNWLGAYNFLNTRGATKLNTILREHNPLELLGKKTITVKVTAINPISNASFEVDWIETTVNANGQSEGDKNFSGIFTIMIKQPTSQKEILQNPLGIYLTDFNFSTREK